MYAYVHIGIFSAYEDEEDVYLAITHHNINKCFKTPLICNGKEHRKTLKLSSQGAP